MHRSRFTSFCIAVIGAASAFTSAAMKFGAMVKEVVTQTFAHHFVTACAMAAPSDDYGQSKPGLLVKAKAFKASLMKRDKPVMSTSWRMCPST